MFITMVIIMILLLYAFTKIILYSVVRQPKNFYLPKTAGHSPLGRQ